MLSYILEHISELKIHDSKGNLNWDLYSLESVDSFLKGYPIPNYSKIKVNTKEDFKQLLETVKHDVIEHDDKEYSELDNYDVNLTAALILMKLYLNNRGL